MKSLINYYLKVDKGNLIAVEIEFGKLAFPGLAICQGKKVNERQRDVTQIVNLLSQLKGS